MPDHLDRDEPEDLPEEPDVAEGRGDGAYDGARDGGDPIDVDRDGVGATLRVGVAGRTTERDGAVCCGILGAIGRTAGADPVGTARCTEGVTDGLGARTTGALRKT